MKQIKINITKDEVKDSIRNIEGEMSVEDVNLFRTDAINHLKEHIELPGFRKGMVPEKIIAERVGEASIFEEASEIALRHLIPDLVTEKKVVFIGRPDIRMTKIAPGNPVTYTMAFLLPPTVNLPDYKKIAGEMNKVAKDDISVSDEDIKKTIETIQRNSSAEKGTPIPPTENVPPLTEESLKLIGDFKDIATFTEQVREGLISDRKRRADEKRRSEIIDAIIKKTEFVIGLPLIENELDRMEDEFAGRLKPMGINFDKYLETIKKKREDVRAEWKKDAEMRVKSLLVLQKVAEVEKIVADEKEIEGEVNHLLEHHKDADKTRTHHYVEMVITNQKVLDFLVGQK